MQTINSCAVCPQWLVAYIVCERIRSSLESEPVRRIDKIRVGRQNRSRIRIDSSAWQRVLSINRCVDNHVNL